MLARRTPVLMHTCLLPGPSPHHVLSTGELPWCREPVGEFPWVTTEPLILVHPLYILWWWWNLDIDLQKLWALPVLTKISWKQALWKHLDREIWSHISPTMWLLGTQWIPLLPGRGILASQPIPSCVQTALSRTTLEWQKSALTSLALAGLCLSS